MAGASTRDLYPPVRISQKKASFAFGKIPEDLINRFINEAHKAFPNESAACLIWDEDLARLVYRSLETVIVSSNHITFNRPNLYGHESLAVELHSHGRHKTIFSPVDNGDDRYEVKISGVIGSLHKQQMTAAFRLCTGGGFIKVKDLII